MFELKVLTDPNKFRFCNKKKITIWIYFRVNFEINLLCIYHYIQITSIAFICLLNISNQSQHKKITDF